MSARRVLFIAGAHTEIGKTHVGCGLLRAARDQGWSVDVFKPVVSGFDPAAWSDSDPGRLLAAAGLDLSDANLDAVSPWRFAAPLAPPMAAEAEGRALPFAPVVDACRARIDASAADLLLVEGVGGLMSPIADGATCLDLLQTLPCRHILVGGSYLGAVSHTLTAFEVMRLRGAPPAAVIISEDADAAAPDFHRTVALTEAFVGGAAVIPVSRSSGRRWTGAILSSF